MWCIRRTISGERAAVAGIIVAAEAAEAAEGIAAAGAGGGAN